MRFSKQFIYTLREDVKDEESVSGNLLVRSGMIKKSSNGIYMFLPLGYRVLEKIMKIIREELDSRGCQELLMPSLLPTDVYEESGRKHFFGDNMFSLKDRYNRSYVLGPTHEEMFVDACKFKIKSYKDMPFTIYQIANKYRDETRPRYGLIRVREFLMNDAYSFDRDLEGLDKSYQNMVDAYKAIFNRIGIDYRIVKADTGVMGGLLSEEFQAVTDIGEDTLVLCDKCGYASNIEVTPRKFEYEESNEEFKTLEKIYTPNVKTIEEVSEFLNEDVSRFVKTLVYKIDDSYVGVLIPGDREVNELKLQKHFNASVVAMASKEEVLEYMNCEAGFLGPIGVTIPLVGDIEVSYKKNFIVGANEKDYHYKNVNLDDIKDISFIDLVNVIEKDPCPICNAPLEFKKGIEIGNTFKLGDKYTKALNLSYQNELNETCYPIMGCYGIGVGRILSALVEQSHDEKGIIFPESIAPYLVDLVIISLDDEDQVKASESLYEKLKEASIDVLYDDRSERAGVKFNDGDLIGIPYRIVVGKKIKDGIVELKSRKDDTTIDVKVEEVSEILKEKLGQL